MTIVDYVIYSLCNRDEYFELTDEGSTEKYIGVLIEDINDNSFKMSEPFLVRLIVASLSLDENKTRGCNTLVGKPLLDLDINLDGCTRKNKWIYLGAAGILRYLVNSVRPEIQMAVNQTAYNSMNPMWSHELDTMIFGRYLVDIPDRGVI